jgi:hypothetical protein
MTFDKYSHRLEIQPQYNAWSQSVEFYILVLDHSGKPVGRVADLIVKDFETFASPSDPSFSLQPQKAQELADRLWQAGFQPAAANGSAGQLAAVNKHLEDMRTIAFSTLDIK